MKILFLAADTSVVGGIQRYNRTFLAVLRALAMDVRLVEFKGSGLVSKLLFVLRAFFYSAFSRPDVILCSHVNFASTCFAINKLLRVRYVVTLFGVEARTPQTVRNKKLLQAASRVCTVSDYTAEKILAAAPDIKSKLFYLENPIDGETFRPGPKSHSLMERYRIGERKVILTVARLSAQEHYKGYDMVLRALSLLKPSAPDFVYLLVGGGDDRGRIEAMTEQLGLKDKVIFAGVVPEQELVDHYNIADVFVMPSRLEGFGFVFVEALACGIPVVSGKIDGSPHALLEGKLGLLVDPDDPKDIASALESILLRQARPELLNPAFLREQVLAAYGIRKFQEKVRQLFNEL